MDGENGVYVGAGAVVVEGRALLNVGAGTRYAVVVVRLGQPSAAASPGRTWRRQYQRVYPHRVYRPSSLCATVA